MAPENHDEVQTNANLPEMFPQICNKPVKRDTRKGSFPQFDCRNVVVNTGRLVCLLGLKCFIDPVFRAIVDVANIIHFANEVFLRTKTLCCPGHSSREFVRSVHEAKGQTLRVFCHLRDDPAQGVTSRTNAIEHFNITLREP